MSRCLIHELVGEVNQSDVSLSRYGKKGKVGNCQFAHIVFYSLLDALHRCLVLGQDRLLKSVSPVSEHSKHLIFYPQA